MQELSKCGPRARRRRLAFSLIELMAVTAIVTSIPVSQYARAQKKGEETHCQQNLRQIGQCIAMYQMSEGHYPNALFHPDNPLTNERSIVCILAAAGYEIPREMWACPGLPEALRERGLTFVYNDSIAGRPSVESPEKTWVLIEFTCVSSKLSPPHPGGYNILFADGHVVTTRVLPRAISARH